MRLVLYSLAFAGLVGCSSVRPVPKGGIGMRAAMGSLSKDAIRDVIHSHRREIVACYGTGAAGVGKIAVKFVISPHGAVASARVAESTVGSAALESCIVKRVRTWQFPRPNGNGVVIVTYPFLFKHAATASR